MRPRKSTPSYILHKRTGRAQINWTTAAGERKNKLLPGPYGSEESRKAYDHLCDEIRLANAAYQHNKAMLPTNLVSLTIAELIAIFWQKKVEVDYANSTEKRDYVNTLRPLNFLYGKETAANFTPKKLVEVRNLMASGYTHPQYGQQRPLCKRVINQRIKRIQRMFKWAVHPAELLPAEVYARLQMLENLRQGKQHNEVEPVPLQVVEDTLPHLPQPVADMVMLQRLTGLRSQNIVGLQAEELNRSTEIWTFKPLKHKTLHYNKKLVIKIGPKAQEILRPYIAKRPTGFLFISRLKKPYTTQSYCRQIDRTTKAKGLPHWHPHQLRHLRSSEIDSLYGYEDSRIAIGHATMQAHMVYEARDLAKAEKIAREIG